jgi:protein O-GlcNAc transferase
MVFTYHTGPSLDQGSVPYVQHTWCRGVNHLSAQQLDERIRQDRIDILVDLAGYSAGGALQTFAMRPAPVSVTAWGYLTGLGLSCIDYIFADEVTIPRDHGERYTENIVHLPSAMAYNPEPYLPAVKPPPELENGYRTYGYLGRANKITASCFDAWARILHARPDARLILKSGAYSDREQAYRVTNALVARGVEQERIDLRPQTHKLAHAEAHHDVDVCLDVAPQNGGITTLDALWMGCPVVTLAGERLPGRIGVSVNTLAQRTQDIALTWEDYIARAVSMSVSLDERVAIRAAVRDSALVDHKRLVKAVEEAYRVIWKRYVNSASEVAA